MKRIDHDKVSQINEVLGAFGRREAAVEIQPSYSSRVYRVRSDGGLAFLKRYPLSDTLRVHWACTVAAQLRRDGINAPFVIPTRDGRPFAQVAEELYVLTESVNGQPLSQLDVRTPAAARTVGVFAARVQQSLAHLEMPSALSTPTMWNDGSYEARLDKACARVQGASAPQATIKALEIMDEAPDVLCPIRAISSTCGMVHGDFWPGNIIATKPTSLDDLGLIDLDGAFHAPVLLDIAQYIDLAFFRSSQSARVDTDIRLAARCAHSYAQGMCISLDQLQRLPELIIAMRGCSILWIIERHLETGPNEMDALVEKDLSAIEFARSIRDHWKRVIVD